MEALDWVKKGKCCTKSDFSCFSHKKFLKAPLTTFFEASIMSIRYFKKFFEASPIDIKCIDSGSVVWKFYVRECFFVQCRWLLADWMRCLVFGLDIDRPQSQSVCKREFSLFVRECVSTEQVAFVKENVVVCLQHIFVRPLFVFLAQLKDHGELYIENIKSFVWLLLNYNL